LPIQEIWIGHRQCPGLSFICLKRDCPLLLIDGDDPASAEGGRRIADPDNRTDGEEEAEREDENHTYVHHAPLITKNVGPALPCYADRWSPHL